MMTARTKRFVDAAIDELKRNGYRSILILFNTKSDPDLPLGEAMEVLCSETNNPKVVAGMAKMALESLSHGEDGLKANLVN
jgi:hypothetical protein